MSNIISKSVVITLCSTICLMYSAYAQSDFSCEDTPFDSHAQSSILKSKYHLFQIFGDNSFRVTNFFESDYLGAVSWVESRLFFVRFSEFLNTCFPLPDPYFTGILKGLKDIDWEDRFDYGIGIEWRPFKNTNIFQETKFDWFNHVRFYAVYLKTYYLQFNQEWSWRPGEDFRFGMELYRECNLYNESKSWLEFWADLSWRKTNFCVYDYQDWVFAFVPKWGRKFFLNESFALMPYLTGELSMTGRTEFWQNRVLGGIGIRIMPFIKQKGTLGVFIKGIRIYVEGIMKILYLKDRPLDNVPIYDICFGLNYTIYRW